MVLFLNYTPITLHKNYILYSHDIIQHDIKFCHSQVNSKNNVMPFEKCHYSKPK